MKVLVVDDNKATAHIIARQLGKVQAEVQTSLSYAEGLYRALNTQYDAIVCDYHFAETEKNGISFLQELREKNNTIPLLLLTGRPIYEISPWEALNAGCDDFLQKPYQEKELIARVFNLIKKSTGATASAKNTLQYESISLDIMAREVFIHNKKIRIGKIPYLMLFKFISTPETVIPPEKLIEYLWGDEALFEEQSNSILRVHIHNLKKLLEKHESVTIENVYGYGYKLHNPLVSS